MIYISHRGNLTGKIKETENHPDTIDYALSLGYHCEIDVWYNDGWFLGHDQADHSIDFKYLTHPKLWIHAKNLNALHELSGTDLNYFWHQEDDYTLTSHRYIWAYPNKPVTKKCIAVMPEWKLNVSEITRLNVAGICSDIIHQIFEEKTNAV